MNGNNYLVPVDAELSSQDALEFEMVRLDLVQRLMENATKTNILFLDACRNNPLSRNLMRALGTRSAAIGRGLAPAESGVGTLISFSTQPGNVALDGAGRNSPYTGPLVRNIANSGQDVLSILTNVRNEVLAATGEKQVPWENHALRARFYFNAKPAAISPVPEQTSELERAWDSIKDSKDIRDFEAFRRQYGRANPFYDGQAERRIDALKKQAAAARLEAEGETKRRREESVAAEKKAAQEAKQKAELAEAKRLAGPSEAERTWAAVKDTSDQSALQAYIKQFGGYRLRSTGAYSY